MFTKILMATDGSPYSDKALDAAITIAKAFKAKLYIIHVVEEDRVAIATSSTVPIVVADIVNSMVKAGEEVLRKAKEKAASAGVDAETILERGNAADKIIETADRLGVDLIVVGSRGLRGLARFLLGSVSEKVVRHANRPVLVYK